jgi:putative ABC transport system ATP-binding protein
MGEIVRLDSVSKRYQSGQTCVYALRSVSLRVFDGEYLAITGPSGSGKSTLLGIIGGLDSPSSGKCVVDGKDLSVLRDGDLTEFRRTFVGFVFQAFNLINSITVLENVCLPLRYAGVSKRDRMARAMGALTQVGLSDRAAFYPDQLSGGEQQRAAIARSVVHGPHLLLADEPTGNLDSKAQAQVLGLFDDLSKDRRTLVVVTHNPVVANRARRVVRIEDGTVAES